MNKTWVAIRITLGAVFFYTATSLALILPRLQGVFSLETISASKKLQLIMVSLVSFSDFYTTTTGSITILNAILFGLVVQLLFLQIKRNRRSSPQTVGKSFAAAVLASIGAGCAACGTLIIGPFLATFGATGLLAALPGHGIEFGLLGTLLLLYSATALYRKIRSPQVCAV